MKYYLGTALALVVASTANTSVRAQSTDAAPIAAEAASAETAPVIDVGTDATAPTVPVSETNVEAPTARCELHVWPTENYLGINSGLLSGFGVLGALADVAVHENKVKTVKDLMAEYLGPDVQMAELNRIGIADTLKLRDYRVIAHFPTPFNEDVKNSPELKAKVKEMNDRIRAKQRLTDSTADCYAELLTTHIFYHKAMLYGSNLFTGWVYREFGDKPTAIKIARGQVKNPLEQFPPKNAEFVEAAKLELRDAYSKDFVEYVAKKVKP